MAKGSVFSISPPQSVNRGLATVYQPVYPEQAAILAQERKAQLGDAALKAKQDKANREALEKLKYTIPEGVDEYDTRTLGEVNENLMVDYAKAGAAGEQPENNPEFVRRIAERDALGARKVANEKTLKGMVSSAESKEGAFSHLDAAALAGASQEEKKRARAIGEEPDYTKMGDNVELYDHDMLDEGLINEYERGIRETMIMGSVEGDAAAKTITFNDSDVYAHYPEDSPKAGEIMMVGVGLDRRPLLKSAPPEKMLADLHTDPANKRRLESLELRADRNGTTVNEELYKVILSKKGGHIPTKVELDVFGKSTPSGYSERISTEASFIADTARGFKSKDPAVRNRAIVGLFGKGVTAKENEDGDLVVEMTKNWVQSKTLDEQRRILAYSDVGQGREIGSMTPEEISALVEDEFKSGKVTLATLDMIGQPFESVLEMMNTIGLIDERMSQVEARKILEKEGYFSDVDNDLSGEDDNYE